MREKKQGFAAGGGPLVRVKSAIYHVLYRAGFVLLSRSAGAVAVEFSGDHAKVRDVQAFQFLYTSYNTDDLREGEFADAFHAALQYDPGQKPETIRARVYFVCKFAELTEHVAGDLLFLGVAYGVYPHCIWKYLGPRLGKKRLILVDPYTGVDRKGATEKLAKYTTDAEQVQASFGEAPVDMIVGYAPDTLSSIEDRPLSFAYLNTGDPESEIASIPMICQQLSPTGAMLISAYGGHRKGAEKYRSLLADLPGTTINLLDGSCLFVKRQQDETPAKP